MGVGGMRSPIMRTTDDGLATTPLKLGAAAVQFLTDAACEPNKNRERRPGALHDFASSAPALAPAAAPLMHAAQHHAGAARLATPGIR